MVVGSTRFFDLDQWAWPQGHPRHGRREPDVCEIGYTWLTSSAIRTPVNTEAKLLMLTHAFESWQVLRVCLHTDMRNLRSRAAIERIGGRHDDKVLCGCGKPNPHVTFREAVSGVVHHVKAFLKRATVDEYIAQEEARRAG